MMSKAAYMMQDHLRQHYALVADIFHPNVFMVRGRLSFPQGLAALSAIFSNKTPADVYRHPYFIEKQSDPTQPSPQLHLTEECQGVMKVIKGLRFMKDDSCKLDNTMGVATDYNVAVKARMIVLESDGEGGDEPVERASFRKTTDADRWGGNTVYEQLRVRTQSKVSGASMSPARAVHVDGWTSADQEEASNRLSARASHRGPSRPAQRPSGLGGGNSRLEATLFKNPSMTSGSEDTTGPSILPTTSGSTTSLLPDIATGESPLTQCRVEELVGGYTVLYNPIETNSRTFVETVQKIRNEERAVKAIVVPTRHAWRDVQVWADAFPDAEIVCSGSYPSKGTGHSGDEQRSSSSNTGEVVSRPTNSRTANGPDTRSGWQQLPNGMTGMAFPEVAEEASEEEGGAAPNAPRIYGDDPSDIEAMVTDVLLTLPRSESAADALPREFLRPSDLERVRPLHNVPFYALTPTLQLCRVPGDAATNEYVLFDTNSKSLACTDLFHGPYGDYDPVNSWMCRVWFKFMKQGDYKRVDVVPHYKWLQVSAQRGEAAGQTALEELKRFVDELTTSRPIECLLFAHGTPPSIQGPADALRGQWGLPPLR